MERTKITFLLVLLMSMAGIRAYGQNITFADANVKALCVANWDDNKDGALSEAEAAAVTDLGEVFKQNADITSFNELKYFTGLQTIGERAFRGCSGLLAVTIPCNVKTIGSGAFSSCSALATVTIMDLSAWCNVTFEGFISSHHLYLNGSKIEDLVIPNGVTAIKSGVFSNCSDLTSVTIPSSVETIGDNAFSGCSKLSRVNIEDLFAWCNITFGGTSYNNNYANPLGYAHHLYLNGSEITKLVIPNSVTSIGNYAFFGCEGLTSITIPNGVTSIGKSAFMGCKGLTSLTFPGSVESINGYAFMNCSELATVIIPSSVETIGAAAFMNCSKLAAVYVGRATPISIQSTCFNNCAKETLFVPVGAIPDYSEATGWKTFQNFREFGYKDMSSSDISVTTYSLTYSGLALTPEVTVKDGATTLTDGVDYTVSYSNNINASITAAVTVTGMGKYTGTKTANFTINKAPLTVTAKSYTINEGDALPTFEAQYSGFKNGETSSVLTTQPTFSCSATPTSEPGEYEISVSGAAANNYNMTFIAGTLTINATAARITISSVGEGTFCSDHGLDFTGINGIKAYIASGYIKKTGVVMLMRVYDVPADEGLMVKGTPGTHIIPYAESTAYYSNMFKGNVESVYVDPTEGSYTNYYLSNGENGLGFYRVSSRRKMSANRSILQLPTSLVNSARSIGYVYEDETTGLQELMTSGDEADGNRIYNLNGQKVETPKKGRLYIINGKKTVIR